MKSPITTHILDTARGRPAAGVAVTLERQAREEFTVVGVGTTNDDGRVGDLMQPGTLSAGVYRITFDVGSYFKRRDTPSFYPSVSILFEIVAPDEHYHVPLLLNPFGYSTYRGS